MKKVLTLADVVPTEHLHCVPFAISFLWDEEALIQVELSVDSQGITINGSEKAIDTSVEWLHNYFRGKVLAIPIKLFGTPFQQQVLLEMQRIPFGKTASYSDIARLIGRERAMRGVGQACGSNPIPLVLPCHRVISHKGTIGGFSNDIRIKQSLLELEQRFYNTSCY